MDKEQKTGESMERLTQTSDKGGVAFTFDLDVTCQPSEMKKILRLAEKLKEYEDAEEKGLLVKIKCQCKDCSHWINACAGCTDNVKLCDVGHYMVGTNGFCVYAERKRRENEADCVNACDTSDDVCEWRAIGANDNWSTSCDKRSIHNVFGVSWFKKCPYCGRKIKGV